ncbi:MAG TPA: baseplate J/gp47 family protein [Microlunatus sp.]
MSFRAEPYGVFVDDLVSALTGGITRQAFRFVPELEPFRLDLADALLPDTVRVHGLAADQHTRFRNGVDFDVDHGVIVFRAAPALHPDLGSWFYASYEPVPDPQAPPRLTDRNPGSILRTLAESFAREYAVLSRQLEQVYEAAFLDTATGRDLDQLVALVGLERRAQLVATGEVVFSRSTPAPGEITIEEGTAISTADVPGVTVRTTDSRTLRTGSLSVTVPVAAEQAGAAGIAPAGSLSVIHRPILGITAVTNPQPTAFGGQPETDEALRRRARRALDLAGGGTTGAIIGALASVDGIRDLDVRVSEDHVGFPGVVKVTVAVPDLDAAHVRQAADLLEAVRPAGIRILHNLAVTPTAIADPGVGGGADDGPVVPAADVSDPVFSPMGVVAAVTPRSATLSAEEKAALVTTVETVIETFVDTRAVAETVVYNQLVAAVMVIDGVQDVVIDLHRGTAPAHGRQNLAPSPIATRPRLDRLDVTLRGAPIALDVTVHVERLGEARDVDKDTELGDITTDLGTRITTFLATLSGPLTHDGLDTQLSDTARYRVDTISYVAEFVDEGLRVLSQNVEITAAADQQLWLRSLTVTEPSGGS